MFKTIQLKNFRSFDSLDINLCGKKDVAQKFVAIYGENGSGKTNIIQSIAFLKSTIITRIENRIEILNMVRKGFDYANVKQDEILKESLDNLILNISNKLSDMISDVRQDSKSSRMIGSKDNMETKFCFEINGLDVDYLMEFDSEGRIVRETLYSVLKKNKVCFYECIHSEEDLLIHLNDSVFSKKYSKDLSEQIKKIWGNHTLLSLLNEQFYRNNPSFMKDNVHTNLKKIIDYISCIKLSVLDTPPENFSNLSEGIIEADDYPLLKRTESAIDKFFTRLYSDVRGAHYKTSVSNGLIEYSLYFDKIVGKKLREIPFKVESQGTAKLLKIMPQLLGCINGDIALIDELDSNVHDNLVFELMKEVIPEINGQLIITTHNTSLLEVLEPRSAFILNVDAEGHKTLLSLDKIEKSQKNHNNRLRYKNGVYGGIPYLAELNLPEIAEELRTGAE